MDVSQAITIRNKIIGLLVKRARLRAGTSQKECAELCGCSASTFSKYEQGLLGLSLPQLEALSYFLDVPLASLWDEGYEMPQEVEHEPVPVAQMMQIRQKMLAVQFR